MKKIVSLLIAAMMLLTATCALAEMPVSGGWVVADSTEVSEKDKAIFDKAMEGLLGVDYEPIAYLGNQVVAGLNHCFLCKATVVVPDAETTLVLVYIYQDLDGNADITNIVDLNIAALSTPVEAAE